MAPFSVPQAPLEASGSGPSRAPSAGAKRAEQTEASEVDARTTGVGCRQNAEGGSAEVGEKCPQSQRFKDMSGAQPVITAPNPGSHSHTTIPGDLELEYSQQF